MVRPTALFSPRSPAAAAGGSTASSVDNNKRHLVHPTEHSPWSVDVVSLVPEALKSRLEKAVAGSIHCGRWACLAFPGGKFYVWQIKTNNLSEALERPLEIASIFLPDLLDVSSSTGHSAASVPPPLVALTASGLSPGHHDSVHLYALNPQTGWLVMRKIHRRDLQPTKLSLPRQGAKVRIVDNAAMTSEELLDDDETFTCLACHSNMVVVGTSKGKLFWVTHIAVPLSLQVQKVEVATSGLWSKLFGSSGNVNPAAVDTGSPCHVLPLTLSANTTADLTTTTTPSVGFVSVSTRSVVQWTVQQPLATGHHATFQSAVKGNLAEAFAEYTNGSWQLHEVLKSQLSADQKLLHCIVRAMSHQNQNEWRLYWIVTDMEGNNDGQEDGKFDIVNAHWLSRFATSQQVHVQGMVSCENGTLYTAVSIRGSSSVILMVMIMLAGEETVIQEVDLAGPTVPGLLPQMMDRDTVTHGCYMIASTGIGVRARFMAPCDPSASPSKRPRLAMGETGGSSSTSRSSHSRVQTLVSHLRSFFWESYQDPTVDRPMPPSLRHANPTDLEKALLYVANELQQRHQGEDSISSASTSIQWHNVFVDLIQQGAWLWKPWADNCSSCFYFLFLIIILLSNITGGLYRSLSENGKWKMLGVCQEISVFGNIAALLKNQSSGAVHLDESLKSYSIAKWLEERQSTEEPSLANDLWHNLLATAVDTALSFREEYAGTRYDITTQHPSEPSWLSHPSMLSVLRTQLESWRNKQKNGGLVARPLVESVVKATLVAYLEATGVERDQLDEVKRLSMYVLRRASDGDDQLAFDLCVYHEHFHGLCEISVANEKKQNASNFGLDPLFSTMMGRDLVSGFTFPKFVLQWHADRDLLGHVINYGRHSPEDLKAIMKDSSKLRKHQWIPAIRHGFFGQAKELFLENSQEDNGLKSTEWSLCMAKLANRLVANQNQHQIHEQVQKIEKKLDLVYAQRMLMGIDDPGSDNGEVEKMSPDKLIELSITKLDEALGFDDRVYLAIAGLTACNSMGDVPNALDQISRIWAECLLTDLAKWTDWAFHEEDLLSIREEALSETVFGRVLEECRSQSSMSRVTYGKHIEASVIDRVQGDENREEFKRLLRAVATPSESIQAESMMVSSY